MVESLRNLACDPTLSSPPPSNKNLYEGKRSERRRQFQGIPLGVNTFVTISAWKIPERKETSDNKTCALCNKAHNIDTCYEFMTKPISDRKAFASTKGLCFGCLESGHQLKDCPKRSTCNVCRKSHPTSLHGDFERREGEQGSISTAKDLSKPPSSDNPAACFASTRSQNQAHSMIVPVWLHHRNDPSNERLVHALLDDQSNTTFVGHNTLAETSLLLSTMHATDEPIKSQKIEGLVVKEFHRQVTLQLPKAFSREDIPGKREQIPRPESALQWPHLKKIATPTTPYQSDIEAGILIGSECPRAIMPREVIPGEDGNPYALRSDLGWRIVGRISQPLEEGDDEDEIGVSHRIHTCEVRNLPDPLEDATRHVKKTCNFSIKTQMKEVIQMFERKSGRQPCVGVTR